MLKLSGRDRDTLRAIAATLLPEGGGLPSAESVGTSEAVAAAVERLPAGTRSRLVGLVRTVSVLPLAAGGLRRFRNLSPAARARVASRLLAMHGYRGIAFSALKQLVVTTWASDPTVTAALGDDGECLADSEAGRALVLPLLPPGGP